MNYIDYKSMSLGNRMLYQLKRFFTGIPKAVAGFFVSLIKNIGFIILGIGNGIKNYFKGFISGDWATRISYALMGFGCAARGQIVRGFLFFAVQAIYALYMVVFGIGYIIKFSTLGTVLPHKGYIFNESGNMAPVLVDGDNSMLILLYGVTTIIISVMVFACYIWSVKSAYAAQKTVEQGKKPVGFIKEFKDLFDKNYHITLLSLPTLLVGIFTILPLVFMILIAFTEFGGRKLPPELFTWVGFENFKNILGDNKDLANAFGSILGWTFIWAVAATFSNYILGMVVALMINKKGIKFKSLFRTLFVITAAVPQFIMLLVISQMLDEQGILNDMLKEWGMIETSIGFLSKALPARITVLIVNLWVGIPYTILITSGILMNIPEELYESARIDGASPFKAFAKITLPYMLFVTTPYLITQFIGNFNGFNVIFLLTGGGPITNNKAGAGETDILVTWLYKLTLGQNEYKLAAAIGILIFIICASFSLITFNLTKSAKNEEEFS